MWVGEVFLLCTNGPQRRGAGPWYTPQDAALPASSQAASCWEPWVGPASPSIGPWVPSGQRASAGSLASSS